MNKYLLIRYKNLSATYHKLVQRLESNISKGVFSKFSANKRRVLLHRVGRLQIKLLRLRQQLGMAATTGALVVSGLSIVTESQAQVRAVPNGDMLAVNTFKNNNQVNSTVAVDSDGDFVVVWQDNRNTTNSYDIYLQRYNSACNPLGNEVLVNETSLMVLKSIPP